MGRSFVGSRMPASPSSMLRPSLFRGDTDLSKFAWMLQKGALYHHREGLHGAPLHFSHIAQPVRASEIRFYPRNFLTGRMVMPSVFITMSPTYSTGEEWPHCSGD